MSDTLLNGLDVLLLAASGVALGAMVMNNLWRSNIKQKAASGQRLKMSGRLFRILEETAND